MNRAESRLSLAEVVLVHLDAFPGFFMAQLGPRFLCEYYRCVIEYPKGVLLTEYAEQRCVGIVAGFVDPASFYRELRSRRVRLGLAAVAGVVRRPRRMLTLLRNYSRARGAAGEEPEPKTAELSSLAVRPGSAGRGVGTRLVHRFITTARNQGADRVVLSTDAHGNDAVNRFYQALGFNRVRTVEARRGRLLNEYVIEIGKDFVCEDHS